MSKTQKITHWSRWYLSVNRKTGKAYIRRCRTISGKVVWERYSAKDYSSLSLPEIKELVTRLNAERDESRRRDANKDIKSALFPQRLLDDFAKKLEEEIPTREVYEDLYKCLQRVFLRFYLQEKQIKSYKQIDVYQSEFRQALFSEHPTIKLFGNEKRSISFIKKCIQVSNRFLKYMNKNSKMPLAIIDAPTRAKAKDYKARTSKRIGKFVNDEDWNIIETNINSTIKPFVQLAYYYGLRRSESLAIDENCLYEKTLRISRQLTKITENKVFYSPLKSREERQTPHWFCDPDKTYNIIESIDKRMHPDTLDDKFVEEIDRLKAEGKLEMSYSLHDFRRTFITRALKLHTPTVVAEAVGHADIKTTMRYKMEEQKQDVPFKPKKSKLSVVE